MKIPYSIKDKVSYELFNILQEISYRFEKNGYECYFVGGFIRDLLLERKKNFEDIDISTNARPEEVMKLFPKVIPTGIKHGTVTILYKGLTIECTTYRKESQYSDHRRPDKIEYSKTIYEDLSRRDFTINALAYNIKKQELIDEFNGIEDLKNRLIRSIGNPKDRFLEDGLRPIRACRFMATLEFEIEQNTKNAILDKDVRVAIQSISIERFTEELKKGFKAKKTSLMLKSLYELKILHLFLENDLYEKIPEDFYYYLDCLLNENLKMSYWFWYQKFDLKKRQDNCEVFDFSQIYPPLVLRNRTEGDIVKIKNGTKKLKKILNEKKVPANERNSVVVLCDRKGILWVIGIYRAYRAFINNKTKDILKVALEYTY
ncbi:MAG: tRNA lysidine(34) synthetase TilS [candidate division WOR-3 bacterium]